MPTLQAMEYYGIIIPFSALFLLLIIPVPLLSKLASKFVVWLESFQFQKVSVMLLIGIFTILMTISTYYDYYVKLARENPNKSAALIDELLSRETARRWRLERNLYMHVVATLLVFSVMKMARLTLRATNIEKEKKKQ